MNEILRTTIEQKSIKVRKQNGLPTVFARGTVNGERMPLMFVTAVSSNQEEAGYTAEEIAKVLMNRDGKPRFIGPYITDPAVEPIRLVPYIDSVWQARETRRNK